MVVVRNLSTSDAAFFFSCDHNEGPSGHINKIGVVVLAIGTEKTWTKKPQERKVHLRFSFPSLDLNSLRFPFPYVYTLFRLISIARYVLSL